jgi:hypothetical protein
MFEQLYRQLPDFARPDHPVMRYLLLREGRRGGPGSRPLRILAFLFIIGILLILGYFIASDFGRGAIETSLPLDAVFLVLYWPLVFLQVLMRLIAFASTIGTIGAEVRTGTWDTLKITTDGATLTMKARWASAFYRMWFILMVLVIARAIFIVVSLYNLYQYQGHYLDLLLSGTVPLGQPPITENTALPLGIVVVALGMTAAVIAPFTALAFDAGLGMLISTFARGRLAGALGQFMLILARILLTGWALWVGAAALSLSPFVRTGLGGALGPLDPQPASGWLGVFFGLAEGDLGLTLLHLPHVGRMWADYDYGILIGVAALGYGLLQAALANFMIWWAGRRATRPERL